MFKLVLAAGALVSNLSLASACDYHATSASAEKTGPTVVASSEAKPPMSTPADGTAVKKSDKAAGEATAD